MKLPLNIHQTFIIKFILIIFLLNPTNTIDAKIGAHLSEEISTQKVEKITLFKKFKPKKERKKWKDLSYGEKSFRMSLWVLACILLCFVTAGLAILPLIICSILSIRLGLRSLKEKEEGISKKKRNQGITISLITLIVALIVFGILLVILSSLF